MCCKYFTQETHFRYTDTLKSDHFMTFSIVEGNIKHIKDVRNMWKCKILNQQSVSINSFKALFVSFDLLSQLDLNDRANPNVNYNILSSVLEITKNRHIPPKKFNILIVVGTVLCRG